VIAPHKRPFNTLAAGFVMDGDKPLMTLLLMGGDMQAQGHAQVVCDLVDHGLDLQQAGNAPRFHHAGSSEPTGTRMQNGGVVQLEQSAPEGVPQELERRGHRVEIAPPSAFGGYQAIGLDAATRQYAGATEPRKDGCARGL
jgi:gamma-glutamyltranspeptidase/glutathione hydrolase